MAERGEYRSISRSLFSGKDFRKLPERPRWIFTVLKMNSGMVGLDTWYEAELYSRLSEESGATIDQVKLALDYLEHEGWIKREDNVVWVVGHLEHDPHMLSSNLNHRKSVQRHVAGMPHLPIVRAFVLQNTDWFPKTEAIGMGIGWVFNAIRRDKRGSKKPTHTHSDHDKEKEDDKEKDSPLGASAEADEFDTGNWPADATKFWSTYVAPIEYGQVGKWLKPSVDRHGWPAVLAGLRKYAKGTPDYKTRRVDEFAREANKWLRFGQMPSVDENGDLTEWGEHLRAISRQAKTS